MALLPTELPEWYEVDTTTGEEKGWTPKTDDIKKIAETWKGEIELEHSHNYTVRLDNLQAISPIQVGGGSFPEGHILPAQIGGIPCIPGSTIRGALLSWLNKKWSDISQKEQAFWNNLITDDKTGWQPRKIRFENISIRDLLKPFPLHAQQYWQVFNDKDGRILSVQWQVPAAEPGESGSRLAFLREKIPSIYIQVLLRDRINDQQKLWLENRLREMLEQQGIGRGKASGFGRLSKSIPTEGMWEIKLEGMKPCVNREQYQWNPQVLRACLRGYFTRLALSLLSVDDAKTLTNKIFGATNCVGQLILTSYLSEIKPPRQKTSHSNDNSNIQKQVRNETWIIQVNASWRSPVKYELKVEDLISKLLELASYLGGLGPGWRRPPHYLSNSKGFRGSKFTVTSSEEDLSDENLKNPLKSLIHDLFKNIKKLAADENLNLKDKPKPQLGSIYSIWRGTEKQWESIVHDVCRTNNNPDRPKWCGDSKNRPSGYAVRQHKGFCLITVFDPKVIAVSNPESEETPLEKEGFELVWGLKRVRSHSQNAS
ncbi:RAMP superfamily CRISPR-associated protein [Floridanema evergladense]|uniref:RAMP superfamily CRISPR-associated protein n=1 Tax=Floridaenema evergladense BLCC-F167 TaxID=3153639 RepID=A0ABV4WD46_9CYAN